MKYKYQETKCSPKPCEKCKQYQYRCVKRDQVFTHYSAADGKTYCSKCIEEFEKEDCEWSLGMMAEGNPHTPTT